jgi:tetratricopeptide (TPR) repeat protein
LKWVAYETLSKKERKARHVAAADYLESSWTADEDEIVEIVASHRLEAYRALPNAEDAGALKAMARGALVKAGQRAASLAANGEAQRYFDQAFELAEDEVERAELSELAGERAFAAGHIEQGRERFERAGELFRSADVPHGAARVSAKLGELLWQGLNRLDDAVELMESSLAVLADDPEDEGVAMLMAQAGRLHYFRGELEIAATWIDRALDVAEKMVFPEVLSHALNTKSLIIKAQGHDEESLALLKHALDIALEHDLPTSATGRALNNLADFLLTRGSAEEALGYDLRNAELSLRRGDRIGQFMSAIHIFFDNFELGRWDEAISLASGFPLPEESPAEEELWLLTIHSASIPILVERGETEAASAWLARLERLPVSAELQDHFWRSAITAKVRAGEGHHDEALSAAEDAFALRDRIGRLPAVNPAFTMALEAAFELGRHDRVEELLSIAESAPPRDRTPPIQASIDRFRGRLAAARGDPDEADRRMAQAIALFRETGSPFGMAVVDIERAEMLMAVGRAEQAQPLLAEARKIFERLRATPWLDRVGRAENVGLMRTAVS